MISSPRMRFTYKQRAKKDWAVNDDRNTTFFHHSIIKRNRENRIAHLQNLDGSHSTTPDQLANTLIHYFQSIFASQSHHSQAPISPYQPGTSVNLTTDIPTPTHHQHNPSHEQPAPTTAGSLDSPSHHTFTNSTLDMQELYDIVK